ncbi:PAS domain S-box protein [Pseudomonas sp. MS15a(2019)]|uniref:PAS domain S-box protein n=1 Tax=Pseudomonas sp. MS15a(2019) TaxID=2579938 RepID=UPI001563F24E|nr:PAS domain S-box protein [Pseudomonas sp. MS15a(2019)]NRH43077.1 PAS domain S-box protein [Pseudomonas sp. MS15a(2019)]
MAESALSHAELQAEVRRLRAALDQCTALPPQDAQRRLAIFDGAIDFAMIVLDPAGVIADWNSGAERLLGWTAAEIRGAPAERFFTPEDNQSGRAALEMRLALQDGRAEDERWHLRRDGTRFWASGEMHPLHDDAGTHTGFVKILRDRTSQHLAGEALRDSQRYVGEVQQQLAESERYWRGLFEQLDEGFILGTILRDDQGRGRDWRYDQVNRAWCAHFGLSAQQAVGQTARSLFPDLEDLWVEDFTRVVDTGQSFSYVRQFQHNGRWYEGHAHKAGPDSFLVLFLDVTEREQAAQATRDEERYRRALAELGEGFSQLGDIEAVTDLACATLGTSLDAHLVGYGLVDAEAETITVGRDWTIPGARSLMGTLNFHDYGSYSESFKRGETVVIEDVHADPRARDNLAALQRLETRALVNLPLFEHGNLVALLYVGSSQPRRWTPAELQFIREVANRTRSATARLTAERALRDSELNLRLVADTLPCLIAFVDRDLIYRFANVEAPKWFKDAPQSILGRSMAEVFAPELFAARRPAIQAALDGTPARLDLPWAWPDGRRRIADIHYRPRRDGRGAVDGFYVFAQDVTVQRDAQALIQAQNLSLSQEVQARTAERDRLWALSEDLLLTADFAGQLLRVSPSWSRGLGYSEAELLSRPYTELIHPDDLPGVLVALDDLRRSGLPTRVENRVQAANGSWRWLSWTLSLDTDQEHVTGAGRDITREKDAAETQALLEEQLRQSQKMEAVGQLTGGLAHDFNNLLAGIVGSLDLLTVRIGQGRLNNLERYTTAAQGAAIRAAALTHRLLAFSRRQTLDPKPTDVNRLVAGMEDLIRRTVGPAIQIEVVASSELWSTLVDPPQLENALLNLCINARDAMPEGGRIFIETANRALDARMARVRDLEPGEYIALSVTDNGCGMPPEVIAKAFDPFFTTKPIGVGTGLGLSMIYGFVRQSGGQARIHSQVDEGTSVTLFLPRHRETAAGVDLIASQPALPRQGHGETVLVVDDEPTVRMLVVEVLEELGYAALEAADAGSGLRLLESDVRIDLLISDVGLPGGMNGRQMADAARQRRPGLKVLFITGYAENAVVGNGHLEPGMHVMTKPFAMDALAVRIRDLIEGT